MKILKKAGGILLVIIGIFFFVSAREFDTLKCKKVPQILEIGFFFVKILFLLYSNI